LENKFGPDAPTTGVTHGANPGMVSHFVKQALPNIAKDTGVVSRGLTSFSSKICIEAQLLSMIALVLVIEFNYQHVYDLS